MAADRIITCTNADGESITFTENGITPFLLCSADGVYDISNTVNVMENTMLDGGFYQGSIAQIRNIVLTVKDRVSPEDAARRNTGDDETLYISNAFIRNGELNIIQASKARNISNDDDTLYITSGTLRNGTVDIEEAGKPIRTGGEHFVEDRALLDKIFKKGEPGKLLFEESGSVREIEYYVESISSTGTHTKRLHTISLICPDPFFYDPDDIHVYLAKLVDDFTFPHEFIEEGETIGHIMGAYENIYNASANDGVGLTISITGTTQIINPVITRLESNEHIGIGTEENPFTLGIGEQIIFTTGKGNKHAYYVHDGITEEVNYLLIDDSSFIQLRRGDNSIGFDAYDGKNTMLVELIYRMQYARA